MAVYKVLQDIEAEDKLVGPLSLRQFVYAAIAAVAAYICVLAVVRSVPFLVAPFFPVVVICGFFAFPWKGEQPTEIWAAARLRFFVKPRVRVWNQSGIKEVVTVTAPKKVEEKPKTDNLSQTEVRSRLKALADTIDSRGWATRNVNYRYYTNAANAPAEPNQMVNAGGLQPSAVPMDAFLPANDMLDDQSAVSQKIDSMLTRNATAQRQQAAATAAGNHPQQAPRLMQPQMAATAPMAPVAPIAQTAPVPQLATTAPVPAAPIIPAPSAPIPHLEMTPVAPIAPAAPMPRPASAPALTQAPQRPELPAPVATPITPAPVATPAFGLAGTSMPAGAPPSWFTNDTTAAPDAPPPLDFGPIGTAAPIAPTTPVNVAPPIMPTQPVTAPSNPAILKLANNNDLNVATIAREANRTVQRKDGEVEVSLH